MSEPTKSNKHQSSVSQDEKAKAIAKEMAPFLIFAAIPIFITIAIALTYGFTHQ